MGFFDRLPRTSAPPPSRRREAATIAVFAAAIAFGVALFSGSLPGLGMGVGPSTATLNGRQYYSEVYSLPFPDLGNNSTPPASVLFHNVTFWTWQTGWGSPLGRFVHGNGTEANGSSYAFLLGGMLSDANRTYLYVSPDGEFAVSWGGEYSLDLLVAE